jgi:protein gp37
MHCYAETLSHRNPALLGEWGKGKPRVLNKSWNEPAKWNKKPYVCCKCGSQLAQKQGHIIPKSNGKYCGIVDGDGDLDVTFRRPRVFPSLCDWLDDEVPIEWLARFMCLIHDTPNLDWLLLTKRPELWNSRKWAVESKIVSTMKSECDRLIGKTSYSKVRDEWHERSRWFSDWVREDAPSNVWIGTSVEDQKRADERIPSILDIPAKFHFLSVEPLLGAVKLTGNYWLTGQSRRKDKTLTEVGSGPRINWVIVGGESGPRSRPCNVAWIQSIVKQCAAAKVPCFVKQVGAKPEIEAPSGSWMQPVPVKHRKGGDPAEWPEGVRVRQFPEVKP